MHTRTQITNPTQDSLQLTEQLSNTPGSVQNIICLEHTILLHLKAECSSLSLRNLKLSWVSFKLAEEDCYQSGPCCDVHVRGVFKGSYLQSTGPVWPTVWSGSCPTAVVNPLHWWGCWSECMCVSVRLSFLPSALCSHLSGTVVWVCVCVCAPQHSLLSRTAYQDMSQTKHTDTHSHYS